MILVVSDRVAFRPWRTVLHACTGATRNRRRASACPRLREYCARIARSRSGARSATTLLGQPVPGFGDPRARVLLIGLAPAAHGANRTGRVFTGDGVGGSGDFLMAALHRAGFANMPTSQHPATG